MENKNMNSQQSNFDAFIEEFAQQKLIDKQKVIIDEFKEMIAVISKLCKDYNISHEMLINRELIDVEKEHYTEDDFAEAVYVYMQSVKELLATYIHEKIKNDYE